MMNEEVLWRAWVKGTWKRTAFVPRTPLFEPR